MTLAIGLMSGTSSDGVTAALVRLSGRSVRVLRCETYPYKPALKRLILGAPGLSVPELSRLNFALGNAFALAALAIGRGARPTVIRPTPFRSPSPPSSPSAPASPPSPIFARETSRPAARALRSSPPSTSSMWTGSRSGSISRS